MVLQSKNINKHFHIPVDFHVLKDINLSIEEGEFVSIMGKSGCGKSTLLYILSTMDTDYDGQLLLNNEIISGKNQETLAQLRNEHIGFVFQFYNLLPDFTVLENVMLPARKLGKKSLRQIREDAMEKLTLLDIAEQANKKAYRISAA